jgi:hypothetical protein
MVHGKLCKMHQKKSKRPIQGTMIAAQINGKCGMGGRVKPVQNVPKTASMTAGGNVARNRMIAAQIESKK